MGRHTASLPQLNWCLRWANTHSTCFQLPDLISTPISLPHVYDDLLVPSPSTSRRPRLAGQDPEPAPFRVPSIPRKLGSEYLLLNLFRKAVYTTAGTSIPESPQIPSLAAFAICITLSCPWYHPLTNFPLIRVAPSIAFLTYWIIPFSKSTSSNTSLGSLGSSCRICS
jgi:hypothetical protein